MPDLLGASNPVPGYDRAATNRTAPTPPGSVPLQNVPDPNRVGRSDGRTERQDSNLQGDGGVRYDSNFQTFLQRLRQAPALADTLRQLFAGGEKTVVLSGLSAGTAAELSQALQLLRLDGAGLLAFLKDQVRTGNRFNGALFALLRSAYARAESQAAQEDILKFLKSYADFSAREHIQRSILSDLENMARAMPESWGEKLHRLAGQLEGGFAAGDERGNLLLLQQEVFPYMSEYVERTHDLGLPRALLSLLALNTARYENGSQDNLLEAFRHLTGYGALKEQLGSIDDDALLALLKTSQFDPASPAAQFSERLSAAARQAASGGSAQAQQIFENLISALLVNESVYMPLNHYLLPLEGDGRMLFSELWVDPDDGEEGKKGPSGKPGAGVKLLFKMDVESLGLFDIVLKGRGKDVEMTVSCPEEAAPFSQEIRRSLTEILQRNGLVPAQVTVRRMEQPVTLTEVFPKIYERRNSINVKV